MTSEGLYTGRVWHERGTPSHRFERRLLLAHCDVETLDNSPDGRIRIVPGLPVFIRRRDYLGSQGSPLRPCIERLVEGELGRKPTGRMTLLTQPRAFGLTLNPVSFFFCFDENDQELEAVVAEVTNTPWGERHSYVLTNQETSAGEQGVYRTEKSMHVSPFFGMDHDYVFHIAKPSDSIRLSIKNLREERTIFHARMELTRKSGLGRSGLKTLLTHPFMPFATLIGIYSQALRLALKGAPFHSHPSKLLLRAGSHPSPSRQERL